MYSDLFSASSVQDLMAVLPSLPYAIWETFYVTVLSTLLSLVLGLPLGVLLVAGEKNGVLPLPLAAAGTQRHHQPPALGSLPDPDDYGIPPVPAHHRHGGGYHSHYRSAGGGGIPICGPSGGEQSP